jgi:hypothetical protein
VRGTYWLLRRSSISLALTSTITSELARRPPAVSVNVKRLQFRSRGNHVPVDSVKPKGMADLQTHRAYSRKAYGHAYGMPWPMRRTFLHYSYFFTSAV